MTEKTVQISSITINKKNIISSFKNVRTRNEEIYFTLTDLECPHNERTKVDSIQQVPIEEVVLLYTQKCTGLLSKCFECLESARK